MIEIEDEYSVRVANNTKAFRDLDMAKQYAQALIQNDKAKFSTLLELMTTDNIAEFKKQLLAIESDIEKREERMQQQQQEMAQQQQQQMLEYERENREDKQRHEMDIAQLESQTKLTVAEIGSFKFADDQDINDNQVPDQLEIERLKQGAIKIAADQAIQSAQINQDQKRLELENANKEADREVKRQEIASKERQAQLNADTQKKIAKQKGNSK
jgi:hypothetical protein